MIATDLLALDVDTLRFAVIASMVAGSVVYARTGLVTGGTLTAGYLAILTLRGDWNSIALIMAIAATSYAVVRIVLTRFLALPKPWLFAAFVVSSTIIAAALRLLSYETGALGLPNGVELFIAVSAYVTPGLIAYDFAHQGPRPTLMGVGLAFGGTMVLVVPVLALANWWRPQSTTIFEPIEGKIPDGWFWIVALSSVLLSAALRVSTEIRSAGFLGAGFLVEFVTVEAFVTVLVAATVASLVTLLVERFVVLTPRQRFELSVVFGAMSAWTGLYWGSRLGWAPAVEANAYAVEPLVVVGLLASDLSRSRSSFPKVVLGLTATSAYVWVVLRLATSGHPLARVAAAAAVVVVPCVAIAPAVGPLRRSWANAVRLGVEAVRR